MSGPLRLVLTTPSAVSQYTITRNHPMVNYKFEDGQRVRNISTGDIGYISGRVPGNGTGNGFYYITNDEYNESGPFTADELEAC